MQIYFMRDAFMQQLFPKLSEAEWQDDKRVAQHLRNAYSRGGYTPEVSVEGEIIRIQVDESEAVTTEAAYERAVQYAQSGQYTEAKAIVRPLLEKGTRNAELYRIYGQILAEEGSTEEAINYLIEALRLNPQHTEALIMMGNLYAAQQDMPTSQLFYGKVREVAPDNYLALNNIGGVLAKQGQLEAATPFFERALEVKADFPNALYGLALAEYQLGDYLKCFERCSSTLHNVKIGGGSSQFPLRFRQLLEESAEAYAETVGSSELYGPLRQELENKTGKTIEIRADENIPNAAKLEVAEYRKLGQHRVLYKPDYPAVAHLIMHELIHLELITEARVIHENQLFTTGEQQQQRFMAQSSASRKRLEKSGVDEERINGFMQMLFNGINSQLYNAPIDLFIEQRLYDRYPSLRPLQFLSLLRLNQEAIAGAQSESARDFSPRFVRDANITLSLTQLFLFRELFGLDLTGEVKEKRLHKRAERLYQDFLKMRADKTPGEEYDLIEWWGEDLELNGLYKLVPEQNEPVAAIPSSSPKTPEQLMEALEKDPYGLKEEELFEQESMRQFVAAQRSAGLNMAVVMYMVDAMRYFDGKSGEVAQEVGFEIAHLGRSGINPENPERYSLSTIPGQEFSGWRLLAYMYVSWSIFEPKMVKELQLDFEEEYSLAQQLHEKGMS